MTKRRRERDKPKSGPEALYNPNKRVLLSYASDEEENVDAGDAAEAVVDDRVLANYQMEEYPESDSDAVIGASVSNGAASFERDEEDAEEDFDDGGPSAAQGKATDDWGASNKRDVVTNQWPTLGPVSYGEDGDEDQDYDPETEEALAYLRAVRYERQTIPEILAAPRQLLADADNLQDPHYRNDDETHVKNNDSDAADITIKVGASEVVSTLAEADTTDPQRVFTRLLVERFMEQRTQLHIPPSMPKLAELPDSCPISFPRSNIKASAEWYRLISTQAPLPAQLRSMDQDSILNLLGLVQKKFLVKNCKLSKLTSAWIWSLLARLDDVGVMTNDEVFPIRELGKRAVFLLLSFTSPELAAGLESLEKEGLPATSAKTDQAQSAEATPPTENTLATLEMMLVVIGEAFGQKDLLEFRPTWSTPAKPT